MQVGMQVKNGSLEPFFRAFADLAYLHTFFPKVPHTGVRRYRTPYYYIYLFIRKRYARYANRKSRANLCHFLLHTPVCKVCK